MSPHRMEAEILELPTSPESSIELPRIVEAVLFASSEPVTEKELSSRLPEGADLSSILSELRSFYENRGVHLVKTGDSWAFRTAPDLSFLLRDKVIRRRKLSRAALEVLAIIAYHQPVTRAEIEEIRGVMTSRGTLDVLLETGWVRLRGRRRGPGRPVTYGTSREFLDHFSFSSLDDLPGLEELKGAGLLQSQLPPDMPSVVSNDDDPSSSDDSDDSDEYDESDRTDELDVLDED